MDIEVLGDDRDGSPRGSNVAARLQPGRTGRGVTSVVEPGRRCLGDRYELDQLIAAGGMGQVWRADGHRPAPAGGRQGAPQRVHRRPDVRGPFPRRGPARRLVEPPQHRRRLRLRRGDRAGRHRRDAGLPRDGAGGGRAAVGAARARGSPGHRHHALAPAADRVRAGRGAPLGHGPPGREAREHHGPARRRREDHRLRHRLVGAQRRADPHRPGHRHAAVPLPRAGRGQARHPGQRRVRARPDRLRVPRRASRLRGRQRRHDRAQAGAARSPSRCRARCPRRSGT